MKKAIIQFKNNKKIINIPEYIYLIGRFVDKVADDPSDVPEIFDEAMDYLNNYYSEIGTTVFCCRKLIYERISCHGR